MSVIKKSDFVDDIVFKDADKQECFFCGDLIGGLPPSAIGAVVWAGGSGDMIYLHPQCAQQLGMHLIKDGLIAESGITGYKP